MVEVYFPHDQKWHKGKVIGGGRGAPYLVEFIDGRADIAPDRINEWSVCRRELERKKSAPAPRRVVECPAWRCREDSATSGISRRGCG